MEIAKKQYNKLTNCLLYRNITIWISEHQVKSVHITMHKIKAGFEM